MPMSQFTMWGLLTLMAIGAVGGTLVHGGALSAIRGAYPNDPAQRLALHNCGAMDAGFSRFSANDRESCYRALLPAAADASSNGVVK
jgi:hypothetical protein